jgi:hypothetical protein
MTQRPNGKGGQTDGPPGPAAPSPADTWSDWVTIWQSELNALATDREAQEVWKRLVGMWAAQARAAGALLPDGSRGPARPEPAARPEAPAVAPGAGEFERQQRELERLAQRVAELERRLASLGGGEKP